MANQRRYNVYDRNKQSRNKYGIIYDKDVIGGTSIYNSSNNQVGVEMSSLPVFRGATRTEDGTKGIVPAPEAGQNTWFLQGSGGWKRIPAFERITDFPESEGLEKRGLQVKGDLNVTDTLTTMNLEVQGAAHFFELIVSQVNAQGGTILVSPSMFHVDFVGESVNYNIFDSSVTNPLINLISSRADIYNILTANNVENIRCRRLWQRKDDGNKAIRNECQIGDMMRCKSFNVEKGVHKNIGDKDYWTFVCNVGDGEYSDYEGNSYPAFYIDIAYTLRDVDGHNYPLGTILFADGSTPVYPKGYTEITDAFDLKVTSQEALDGTNNVEWPEYFENSEWTSIMEQVIKIRGLDDQVYDITGKQASNNLYDNNDYVEQAQQMLNEALTGETAVSANTGRRSATNVAQMIIDGTYSDTIENDPEGLELTQAESWADASSGINDDAKYGLKINNTVKNKIILAEDTFVERKFIVSDDVINKSTGDIIYHKGDILNYGDTIIKDVPVFDLEGDITLIKTDLSNKTDISVTEEEADIINKGTTVTAETGMDKDVDAGVNTDYSQKTQWQFGYVDYYPDFILSEGDSLACLGHMYDDTRQNAILISSTKSLDPELIAPCIGQYSHIDQFSGISKFRQSCIASNGNEYIGSFLVNYNNTYVDINERINMMIMDVKSGLEAVGIHLDGENSTITLVGSVDLKQHSNGSYDTLNLYDNIGIKRVEITPFNIPKKSSSESQIDVSNKHFNYIYDWKTANKEYISYDRWKDWDGPFWYSWVYKYELDNYIVYFNTSANLGYLEAGTSLDLRDLLIKLNINPWLCGRNWDAKRLHNKQYIASFSWTLKRNGVSVSTGTGKPETSGDDSADIVISLDEILDDYIVDSSGTYTLDINLGYKVYAYVTCGYHYKNYYYIVECRLTGSVKSYIDKSYGSSGSGGHKLTIGTNGIELVNNNSRWLYAADDAFELVWDDNYITMDDTRGLYIRRAPVSIPNNKLEDPDNPNNYILTNKNEIVFCENTLPHSSYTVTLPDPIQFGKFREITILGWLNTDGTRLTIAANKNSKIELNFNGYQEVNSFRFGDSGGPVCSCTLIATATNRWRIINIT